MPRTVKEILEHADELAKVFEDHEPDPEKIRSVSSLRAVATAFRSAAAAQDALIAAVSTAREQGRTWAEIGAMVGTSAEAARQRYKAA